MMELREQIARALAHSLYVQSWSDWLPEADAVIEVLRQQEPAAYLYEYVSPIDGITPVWRTVSGSWNGQQARSAKPLYLAPAAQAAVPEGRQIVPKELTPYMARAMHEEAISNGTWKSIWAAALEAAPKPGEMK